MKQNGPAGAFKQICSAAHICSYALSRNMWSMLPRDGSMSCQISWSRRSIALISSAYYCRPCRPYIEGGQYAHDLLHTGTDASDVRRESGRAVSRSYRNFHLRVALKSPWLKGERGG
jgi:hypothetical protein